MCNAGLKELITFNVSLGLNPENLMDEDAFLN